MWLKCNSVENLKACEEEKVDAYVPDQQFRKRDVRFKDADRHRRPTDKHHQKYKSTKRDFDVTDFKMNEDNGKLICPAGKELYVKNRNFMGADGYKYVPEDWPFGGYRHILAPPKRYRLTEKGVQD